MKVYPNRKYDLKKKDEKYFFNRRINEIEILNKDLIVVTFFFDSQIQVINRKHKVIIKSI